jgi:pseudouridine-5'-phosphate glycosidase
LTAGQNPFKIKKKHKGGSFMNRYLDINPEVAAALAEGKPVVALESTIISHGMPYPQNVETALNVEAIIRENGAVPATIAISPAVMNTGTSTSTAIMTKSMNTRQSMNTGMKTLTPSDMHMAKPAAAAITMIAAQTLPARLKWANLP